MRNIRHIALAGVAVTMALTANGAKIDYSIVSVPEEGGVKFERITEDADAVSSAFPAKKVSSALAVVKAIR